MMSRHMDTDIGIEDLSHLPSDDSILNEIREILRTADLMTVTKKSIKQELERRFGVNLDLKRPYINSGMFLPFPPLSAMNRC
jgi:chitin synthase